MSSVLTKGKVEKRLLLLFCLVFFVVVVVAVGALLCLYLCVCEPTVFVSVCVCSLGT